MITGHGSLGDLAALSHDYPAHTLGAARGRQRATVGVEGTDMLVANTGEVSRQQVSWVCFTAGKPMAGHRRG